MTQDASVAFVAAAVNPGTSTVVAGAATQTTDGGATITITVTLNDAFGNPVAGETVTVEATGTGNTISTPAVTDAAGQTTATISSTKAEEKTVTAKVGTTAVGTDTVTFTAGAATQFAVSAAKTTLASDGKGTTTVRAQVLDANGNLVTTDSTTSFTFDVTHGTYLVVNTSPVTATNGIADTTITTQGGVIPSPPATDTVTGAATPALTGNPATVDITIVNFSIQVDAPVAPFVDGTGVHLVTSASTPSTADFSGVGSTTGDYRWTLASVGTINGGTTSSADNVTYTAPATLTLGQGETFKKDTLTLTSALDAQLTDDVDVFVYNPVAITDPVATVGLTQRCRDRSRKPQRVYRGGWRAEPGPTRLR